MIGILQQGGGFNQLFMTFSPARQEYYAKFEKFRMIDTLLEREYADQALLSGAKEAMIERALQAYVAGLEDPYTTYLTAEENTQLQHLLHDQIGISGIGAMVEKKDRYVQIIEVIKNGPAYQAGLQPLDRILFIETGSTADLSTSEAVERIRGEKGTTVRL